MTDAQSRAADDHVLDADGHFHAIDAPIDLRRLPDRGLARRSASSGCSALDIFYQFFTRYVLNDSAAWTEEIARYLLICTVFVGVAAAVRRTRHIHVEFLYRLIPAKAGRALSTLVDIVRIAFFAYASCLTVQMMPRMGNLQDDDHRLADELHLRRRARSASPLLTFRSVQVAIATLAAGLSACSSGPSSDRGAIE